MKKENNVKPLSTIWLDFISYIFMPFYVLVLSLETLKLAGTKKNFIFILAILCLIFSVFTFYKLFKKNKLAYYLMYIFYPINILTIVLYFCNRINLTNSVYVLELVIVGLALWTIPNYIYLFKRKDIFREHNVAHIKKCPGCNRIIPVIMVSCGKCGYKENKNEYNKKC